MASSGSFTGSGVGTSPYLILDWAILQQDIANNRSQVRLTLKCYSQYYVNFSATKSGVLEGTSFSYSGGMSGSNITKTLYTKDMWITHDSDGKKSIVFDATFNIAITWSGSYLPSLSVSGTAVLDDIPRSSLLNSFSMGSNLKVSTANSINLSITRYDGSFTHDITLKLGSYVVATWTGQGVPTSLSLTVTQVNEILSRITSGTTATVTLVVQTKLGSTNIGSSVSRTATATVDSTVVPTATGLAVSIYGSGHDSSIGKFIEDISKAVASFNAAAGFGASITSTSIVVRRDSDDADPHNISGTSGTTGILSLSGTYEAYATVTDSRNRTATQKITFTVYAYSAPKITAFTAQRNSADETIANISASGTFTVPEAGDNSLDILIETRIAGGSWSMLVDANVTASPFAQTPDSTGHAITSSYEFRITVADAFGKSATSVVSISTSKVVLAIYKDEAVGIGKIPEAGGAVLQVGEDVVVDGNIGIAGDMNVNNRLALQGKTTAEVSNAGFTYAFSILSDGLSSSCLFSVRGTTASTVVDVVAEIIANHSHDIYLRAEAGDYTELTIRVISNGNEDFDVYLKTNSSYTATLSVDIIWAVGTSLEFTNQGFSTDTKDLVCKNNSLSMSGYR